MSSDEKIVGIKSILVGIDGSENAIRAVKVASQIAKNNQAELTILHVMAIPSSVYSGNVYVPLDKIEEKMKLSGEKFVATAVSFAEEKGIKPKTVIAEGIDSPARKITTYSEDNNIDLIVVGTRGLGGFKRLLLGSVASEVVHYAHCSVLVVR